jgi:hypothetical protein
VAEEATSGQLDPLVKRLAWAHAPPEGDLSGVVGDHYAPGSALVLTGTFSVRYVASDNSSHTRPKRPWTLLLYATNTGSWSDDSSMLAARRAPL